MLDDILTEEQLCPIAGHFTRSGLRLWLDKYGIKYLVASSGWPRVHRKALERAMGVAAGEQAEAINDVQFNFESLR